jgi:outer membrane protein assembly factor BamE
MDIEQGNVMTQDTVNKIHRGMTAEEVKDIMGNPVLSNVFDGNRMDYVYTFKPGYGEGTEKFVTVIFKHGRVSDIEGNLYSTFMR